MSRHIVLTSHPPAHAGAESVPVYWGAPDPQARGPILAGPLNQSPRNVIGSHSGAYAIYRALSVASGALAANHKPDLKDTGPADIVRTNPHWSDPHKIVSLDPWGHLVATLFADRMAQGIDIRPTIAITRAHINMGEIRAALAEGRLCADGRVLVANGDVRVTKIAIDPVWYLPGIAHRFAIEERPLRRHLFEQTGGMFPELVTRPDLKVFLPPIGGTTVYVFGNPDSLGLAETPVACRVHDECNGSDVFGSDICTCRPYLAHGVEVCIEMAQQGGVGLIVYNRKEGRALGEVTKFLVYNARKRQEGGDRAQTYFERTECVAGVQDMRFQELMPDVLHWLGVTRIDRWASMSDMKYEALVSQGIEVKERVAIPEALIPADAHVEMDAKKAAGYFSETDLSPPLMSAKGRSLDT